jgi:hypothetical protein
LTSGNICAREPDRKWQAQASLEVEERKLRAAAVTRKRLSQRDAARIRFDTVTGMLYSNLIGFFIIVATGATLHAHGITQISTAEQAAEALRPLAGALTFFLFSLGIIGTGLLAVPVLAGSVGYAVAESLGWRGSLEMPVRRAPGFYLILGAATLGSDRSFESIQSDPNAVLERRGQWCGRRAANGGHDAGRRRPQDHEQVCGVATPHDFLVGRQPR